MSEECGCSSSISGNDSTASPTHCGATIRAVRCLVAVDNRAGLELILGAAVGTAGFALVRNIEKYPGMMIPQRHFWIRTKGRQIACL